MKDINSLVQDVYKVLDEGVEHTEEHIETFAKDVSESLKLRLATHNTYGPSLRLSGLGRCVRYQHYQRHGVVGEDIKPHTKLKFLYGDIIESLLLCLVKLAGHEVRGEQDTLLLNGIPGHRDAVIDGVTVDVKSASGYGFRKFEKGDILEGDDPFGYIAQLSAYTEAADDCRKDEAHFLVMNKETGKLTLCALPKNKMIDAGLLADQVQAETEDKESVPSRPYEAVPDGKSGNMKLPVACSYCTHKFKCWSDANNGAGLRTFLYSNGPRYLTDVERTPDVKEII